MKTITLTKGFAHYGARLKNFRWAYSARADDGSLVLSCWQQYLTPLRNGLLRYEVNDFSLWTSKNGKSLLLEHLKQAVDSKLPVRMVLATTVDRKAVVAGVDGSKIPKTFRLWRDDLIGKVVEVTSERFIIDFRRVRVQLVGGGLEPSRKETRQKQ